MFIEPHELSDGARLETAICIVGAGAAGIALAREFVGREIDVCLVESGGLAPDDATQSLAEAATVGLPYFPLDANRVRAFGGTTALWAGWSRPLEPLDFEFRPWVPHSGWPLTAAELEPYYRRAHDVCQLGPCEYEPAAWLTRLGGQPLLDGPGILTRLYRLSPPTRFGQAYGNQLRGAPNVRVLLHANAVELETDESGSTVTRLRARYLSGKQISIAATAVVLAAGGIENARLLLLSNRTVRAGLGNRYDQVGRYFMEHIHFRAGTVTLERVAGAALTPYCRVADRAIARLTLSPALQACEELLNCSVMLEPVHWATRAGAAAVSRLVRTAVRRVRWRRHPLVRRLPARLDVGASGRVRGTTMFGGAVRTWRLHVTTEQAPNPDSRAMLSSHRDALGMNRVRLSWQTRALDQRTCERVPELIARELEAAGLGRFRSDWNAAASWPPPPLQGLRGHHMGTTRMSSDPRHGVVDADCRVHGMTNLFVAGSSVFPTSGAGTPTLTIVALALRLADHLKSLLL